MPRLAIDEEQLAQFCQEHHIHKLSLFGSTLKGTARPDSDVDLLVEFEPSRGGLTIMTTGTIQDFDLQPDPRPEA
jgi:predicted nucleotidyltransferase